jgi:phosphoglycolate phosphatase
MNHISAVVFDCDGVMFDSRQSNRSFYDHLLANFGLPPMDEEEVSFVHMHTADESVRRIFRGTSYLDAAQAYRLEMNYSPFIKEMIMEKGLKELLRRLKPKYRLAVATNRSNTIKEVLRYHTLKAFFELVVSSLDVQYPKPHPEALHKILNHFALTPSKCVYVGDSLVDLRTAEAAGVSFIAYKNRTLDAEFHVDGMMEIARLLGV